LDNSNKWLFLTKISGSFDFGTKFDCVSKGVMGLTN
jgi:hypothetical protein